MVQASESPRGDVWKVGSVFSACWQGEFRPGPRARQEKQGKGAVCVSVPNLVAEEAVERRVETRGIGFVQ